MLGREHHERGPEQRVGAGGEHADRLADVGGEVDHCAVAATDPVALHRLDRVGPVEQVEVVEQPVGVVGDPHHPLAHASLEDREVAAVAPAVRGDLLVGDDGSEPRTPVDRRLAHVRQPVRVDEVCPIGGGQFGPGPAVGRRPASGRVPVDQFADRTRPLQVVVVPRIEDLREDPLGPPVVGRIDRRDTPPRVVAHAQSAELAAHRGDVGLGRDRRMCAGLHGVLFGGETERVEAHRIEHVVAGHPLEARVHVGSDVAERVAHVEPDTGRIGEHVEHEQLLATTGHRVRICEHTGGIRGLERALGRPVLLPPELDVAGERGGVAVWRGIGACAGNGWVVGHTVASAYGPRVAHL